MWYDTSMVSFKTMIASAIKQARSTSGFTQDQLAAKLGVSRNTVKRWETGEREPDFDTIDNIFKILNIKFLIITPASDEEPKPQNSYRHPLLESLNKLNSEDLDYYYGIFQAVNNRKTCESCESCES